MGRDGSHEHRWGYRGKQKQMAAGSSSYTISSSAGTIVSTTAYTSSCSRHLSSVSIPMETAMHLDLDDDDDEDFVQPTKKIKSLKEKECFFRKDSAERKRHIIRLVQEFYWAPLLSANRSTSIKINGGGDMSVLERWLSDLGVDWVLHLAGGGGGDGSVSAASWIRGLFGIMEIFRCCATLSSSVSSSLRSPTIACGEEQEEPTPQTESDKQVYSNLPDPIQFALFAKEAILKMLPFLDVVIQQEQAPGTNNSELPPEYNKLDALLAVYNALSDAPDRIWQLSFPSAEVARIWQEMTHLLLSEKENKVVEAICSTMEQIRIHVLESRHDGGGDDSSGSLAQQISSSDIHEATLHATRHVNFLSSKSSSMHQIVSHAVRLGKYVPQSQNQHMPSLDCVVMEMIADLKEKLVNVSGSFVDQGLKFLFLLNNFEFIRWSLQGNRIVSSALLNGQMDFHREINGYMESYLQVSWAHVLSCLFNPTPLCLFGKNYSPLPKFETAFEKTYTTQKLWKVPNPQLRKKLRTSITQTIIPDYTKYIEDHNITTPKFTPKEVEDMLQELFEG